MRNLNLIGIYRVGPNAVANALAALVMLILAAACTTDGAGSQQEPVALQSDGDSVDAEEMAQWATSAQEACDEVVERYRRDEPIDTLTACQLTEMYDLYRTDPSADPTAVGRDTGKRYIRDNS